MEINQKIEGTKVEFALSGRLDTTTAPDFAAVLQELPEEVDDMVLDCFWLEYISSAGLRVLLSAQKKMSAKKGSMKLIHVNSMIMSIFTVSGFSEILTIETQE